MAAASAVAWLLPFNWRIAMEYLSSAIVYTYLFLHVGIILVVTSYYV